MTDSHAYDAQATDSLDWVEVLVLSDDGYPVRQRRRCDPEVVHVQPSLRLGEMDAKQRP